MVAFRFFDAYGRQVPGEIARSLRAQWTLVPQDFRLYANAPNPFNPETLIRYELPAWEGKAPEVRLQVFNLAGQRLRTLVQEAQAPGHYAVQWDGLDAQGQPVSSGVYLYRLEAGRWAQVRRMSLIR